MGCDSQFDGLYDRPASTTVSSGFHATPKKWEITVVVEADDAADALKKAATADHYTVRRKW